MRDNANVPSNQQAEGSKPVQCTFQTVNIVLILVQQRDDTFLLVERLFTFVNEFVSMLSNTANYCIVILSKMHAWCRMHIHSNHAAYP